MDTLHRIMIWNSFSFTFCECYYYFCCPIICADLRGTAPKPLVPTALSLATPRVHSKSWPCPQRSTGGNMISLVGCHLKETLHCCWVTSVVFSNACSDSTYTGHHLLCPLLMTMLAKLWSQTEWASPQESSLPLCPSINPPMWTFWCWGLWSELLQVRKEAGTQRQATMRAWHKGLLKLRLFLCSDQSGLRAISNNAMDHFGLRLPERAADHASCHNYPGVNKVRELWHQQCWSSN